MPAESEHVDVNGEARPMPAAGQLAALLRELEIDAETKGVAVAVNDEIVPRARWESTRLQPGDRVEVVRAVQGG
jgi:sulfur carrier protein